MGKSARVSGFVYERKLAGGEVALYNKLRVPDASRPSGYREENRALGRLWTRGGRPPDGYATKRGAQDVLRERIVDAGRRAGEAPERTPLPTFADVADAWIRAKSRAVYGSTWRDYDSVLEMHLKPAFGPMRVDEVEPRHVAAWKERAADDGMSARLIVRALMVASQVFTHAQRHHDLGRNPASGRLVPRPSVKYDRSRFNVLEPAQVRAVADAMSTAHGRAAVLVSAWTGVRIGELVELRWKDVRWTDQRLHVRRSFGTNGVKPTKGVHGRSVPMTPDLVALLDRLSRRDHATGGDDLVLVTEAGDRVSSYTLRDHFYAALGAAGLGHLREADPPLRWHYLRHTFATRAARVVPLSDVQALCGHADIQTTQRYVHHVPGARDAERLAAAFADEPDPLERAVSQPVSQSGQFGAQRA
jgi:integrase